MPVWKPIVGFDEEAWNWIVDDARRKLAFARGARRKWSQEEIRQQWATRRANQAKAKRARQKERMRHLEQITSENFHATVERWRQRGFARLHVLAAMEPGEWYGAIDIAAKCGMPYRTANGLLTFRLSRDGLVQRAPNPDWIDYSPNERGRRAQAKIPVEPKHLYSLTDKGLDARAKAIEELNALGRPDYV